MGIQFCSESTARAIDVSINFTDNAFDFLIRSSLGVAKNVHEDIGLKKSLNCSETFPNISEYEAIKEKLHKLCKELDERARFQKLRGRTLTLEFKSDKFKNKQKSYTCAYYMESFNQYFKLSVQLLDQAWPMDPCRQISVKLLNLKDEQGRTSETPHFTSMNNTNGSTKIGSKPQIKCLPSPFPGG